jgi:8-amino-7-oxononanoate synthase
MKSIERKLLGQLDDRRRAGNLRRLSLGEAKTDFCSNDYLGLARNPELHAQIGEAYGRESHPGNGATGSRLISGNSPLAVALEDELAGLFRAEGTLLFNSGYAANTALLSAIPQKGDTILYDEYSHASLKEGARLSFANRFAFRHNDLADLERRLQRATGETFVVAESVYSMDGDFAPLRQLLDVCERYGAHLVWDEAHSTGLWGTAGNGIACSEGLHDRIFARIYTFGKAMGVHGACVAGSRVLIEYLVNFARPFIYTTALPLHSLVSVREAFRFLAAHPGFPAALHAKIAGFRQAAGSQNLLGHLIAGRSPIQALRVGGNEATKRLAAGLQEAGFDVRPILSPTVREGEERLRICLHTYNTDEEITGLAGLLAAALQRQPGLSITPTSI